MQLILNDLNSSNTENVFSEVLRAGCFQANLPLLRKLLCSGVMSYQACIPCFAPRVLRKVSESTITLTRINELTEFMP